LDDNVDVEILVDSRDRYSATFFTMRNIVSLFEKNRITGECESGAYMWAANMIIVNDLDLETIRISIFGLLSSGEIDAACHRIRE
jgi:hypothetical protein